MKFHKFTYLTDFIIKDQQVIMTPIGLSKIKRYKKITGSRLGSVLGVNQFQTPFQTWCDMLGFYQTRQEDFFTRAGQIIEPKLRAFVEKQYHLHFQTYEGSQVGYDVFKENAIFGGLPDGEPVGSNQQLLYSNNLPMLEIKTASLDEFEWSKKNNELFLIRNEQTNLPIIKRENTKIKKWISQSQVQIPLSYQYQLGLYLYLRNATKGLFCVGLLKFDDYVDPENYDPFNSEKNLVIVEEFHVDLEKFAGVIAYATQWHQSHIQSGISPKMSSTDLEWLRFGYPEI